MAANPCGPRRALDRGAAADLWRHTMGQIPSVFGRLVYLCSLRDTNTGAYQHFGLAQIFGEQAADEALRSSHGQAFEEWLSFTLEQQKADVDLYLAGLGVDRPRIVETWIRLTPYRNLIPSTAREVETRLYLTDMEVILELLKNEYGVAYPDPDA